MYESDISSDEDELSSDSVLDQDLKNNLNCAFPNKISKEAKETV